MIRKRTKILSIEYDFIKGASLFPIWELTPAECAVLRRLTSGAVPNSFARSAGLWQLVALKERGLIGLQDAERGQMGITRVFIFSHVYI